MLGFFTHIWVAKTACYPIDYSKNTCRIDRKKIKLIGIAKSFGMNRKTAG